MKAVILSIGAELLQGFLTDTNATFLAQELNALGVEVVGVSQVGDDLDRLTMAFRRAMKDADIVITTGGIGPTSDDLTREAVAAIVGETPVVDPETLETVRSFFRRRGAEMPERNSKQAWRIPSADIMANPVGTAPGWFVRHQDTLIAIMPGVPREMTVMWAEQVVPRLQPYLDGDAIVTQTLKTIGIGESAVEEQLRHIIDRGFPTVTTYAKNDGVHVRILAAAKDEASAAAAVETTESEIRAILGDSVYGTLQTSLPGAVLGNLLAAGESLSIWESGTGGQLTRLLLSDDDVTTVISDSHTVPPYPLGNPGDAERVALEAAREGTRSLAEISEARFALSVAVVFDQPDNFGRYDARVGIVARTPKGDVEEVHKLAASKTEAGRRATLLAADVLRRATMDATGPLPG